MKKEKDQRITVGYVSIKDFALIFFALSAFNGFHMMFLQSFEARGIMETNLQFVINALIFYVLFSAACITGLIALVRHVSWNRPMRIISEAAKEIARGNFSARIPPQRKDGKKDFAEAMYDDFNTMTEELASTEILKNDFISNVSHEIKTPLSVIQSYASALQGNALEPEERAEYTRTIIEATQKLSLLVDNILKLNKLENQGIMPKQSRFKLDEHLRRCAVAFEELWERKKITFEADMDEIDVCYDESMLEIVWNNLFSNAIKFTGIGGSIFLSLKTQNDLAVVSLRDTGCGMDEDTRKRIFDKFYQGDTSHAQAGNGLGLALVKKTLELIGGSITVESAPAHGSTFTICLKKP